MDLSYAPEYEAYRQQVRIFLASQWVSEKGDRGARTAAEREFRLRATAAGYLYRNVPVEYGGSGQAPDILKAQIIGEEFERAGAPLELAGVGTKMLVPTLLDKGQDWQKKMFIPKTVSGEFLWGQGYSEPGAGSDLASVRTRAELVDGQWVINGQKVWTTLAHRCHYMFVLARTEPDAPKHAGLSYLLVNLKQPGIEIRPLKQMTGWSEFCEVFFVDAKTPGDWIVGQRGEGWAVTRSTLSHERSYIGGANRAQQRFDRLVDLAKKVQVDGRPAIEDEALRQRLVGIAGALASLTYSSFRQTSMSAHGEDAGIIGLLSKLYGTNIGHDIASVARDLMGDAFMLAPPAESAWRQAGIEKWNNQFMGSLGIAIAGGTSNIQRNIIAERGLGLRDEKPSKGLA
jgi:alkylation response protein AidB-like acyl-CoA dehydrogenase